MAKQRRSLRDRNSAAIAHDTDVVVEPRTHHP